MIRDITLGQFFPGNSPVHKLDARIKIILTVLFIVIIFVADNFVALGLTIVALAVFVFISKISVKTVLKSLKPVLFVILFTAVLNMLYVKGETVLQFWIINITKEGIITGIYMAVRIMCLVASSSLLTYTTSPTELTDAIEYLMAPLKLVRVDTHSIAMMMTIALRFIPTLIEEVDKIMNAQKARGADMESGNLFQRAKAMLPILIPLFVSSFRRAFELAYAMECRCYHGGKGRTRLKQMKMHMRDAVASGVFVLLLAGVIALNIVF